MILQLDLPHICRLADFGSAAKSTSASKRRRLDAKPPSSLTILKNTSFEDGTYITLVNRAISITQECPVDLSELPDSLNVSPDGEPEIREFVSKDIKLTLDSNEPILEVRSTRVGTLGPGLILSLNLFPTIDTKEVSYELAVINTTTAKLRANGIIIQPPTIKIMFNPKLNTMQTNIAYGISLRCTIEAPLQSDVISRVNAIIHTKFQKLYLAEDASSATSQSFYTGISAHTATLETLSFSLAPIGLTAQLMPFQQKSVNWLLHMEGLAWNSVANEYIRQPLITESMKATLVDFVNNENSVDSTEIDELLVTILNRLTYGWDIVTKSGAGNNLEKYLHNPFTSNLVSTKHACEWLLSNSNINSHQHYLPAQGLLAEEMGLGKTVEIAALICANPRPTDETDKSIQIQLKAYGDKKIVYQAKSTLIIAPDSILGQWMDEMRHLAPELRICLYGGIDAYPKLGNLAPLIAKYLRNFDVVFTTYATISSELDYALFTVNAKNTRSSLQRLRPQKPNPEPQLYEDDDEDIDIRPPTTQYQADIPYQAKGPVKKKRQSLSKRMRAILAAQSDFESRLQDEIAAEAALSLEFISHRYNVQSPLIFIQFWRVVLDEVQMVSSSFSRAFKVAALIPRFHAWGVSGTPIKRGIDDLHSILQFLRYSPFCGDTAKGSWKSLVTNKALFDKLWTNISLRHTKAMVHGQIKLPAQNRILLSIPFTRIEQDYYQQIFHECLAAIGLDSNGHPAHDDWEPSPLVTQLMRTWLIRLRQICCSPQIGKLQGNGRQTKKGVTLGDQFALISGIKTLESLLDDMISQSYRNISSVERSIVNSYLERGEFFEFIYEPCRAIEYLLQGARIAEQKVAHLELTRSKLQARLLALGSTTVGGHEAEKALETLKSINNTRRSWDIMLHRLYFLIASCYFQQYDPEYASLIDQYRLVGDVRERYFRTSESVDISTSSTHVISSGELISTMYGIDSTELNNCAGALAISTDPNGENNETPQTKEVRYYALAEHLRQDILKATIANVDEAIQNRLLNRGWCVDNCEPIRDSGEKLLPKSLKRVCRGVTLIEDMSISTYATSLTAQIELQKIEGLVRLLNRQATLINKWMESLLCLLSKRMVSHDKGLNGEEYEESLQDQTKISAYLLVLEQAVSDRAGLISEPSTNDLVSKSSTAVKRDSGNKNLGDDNFETSLKSLWDEVNPKIDYSLLSILADIKEEVNDNASRRINSHLPAEFVETLCTIRDNQKSSCTIIRNELKTHCNAIFNTRIEYFKQLQQISDSVKTQNFGMDRKNLSEGLVLQHLEVENMKLARLQNQMAKAVAKFRYLKTLDQGGAGLNEGDAEDLTCIICCSKVTIGSLTHCGHKYCKECLDEWLKTSKTCPMCKAVVTESTVHPFSHYKPDLKATKVHERECQNEVDERYSIYQLLPENAITDIQNIKLSASYSSKVDLIVKKALSLKRQDPAVKIVVFSQWQDMLYLLGMAFKTAGISYVASYGTVVPEFPLMGRSRSSTRNKYESVERFKDPTQEITCFLLNAKAQASGLTLVNATHVFLCEPLVNTALELQAISRIHRIGQTKATTVWMFAIENTVEQSIVTTSNKKRLQYAEEKRDHSAHADRQLSSVTNNSEVMFSEIDSITLMKSSGGDLLVDKGSGQGEAVQTDDLWGAFFGSKNYH